MAQTRIQVYADEEIKRRVMLAAARRHVATTEYCLAAIVQQLADDEVLEQEEIVIPIKQKKDDTLIADLRALRDSILTRRGGEPIDIDIVNQVRAERDYELTSLH